MFACDAWIAAEHVVNVEIYFGVQKMYVNRVIKKTYLKNRNIFKFLITQLSAFVFLTIYIHIYLLTSKHLRIICILHILNLLSCRYGSLLKVEWLNDNVLIRNSSTKQNSNWQLHHTYKLLTNFQIYQGYISISYQSAEHPNTPDPLISHLKSQTSILGISLSPVIFHSAYIFFDAAIP